MSEQVDLSRQPGGGLEEGLLCGGLEERQLGTGEAQAVHEVGLELVAAEGAHVVTDDDALCQGFVNGHAESSSQLDAPHAAVGPSHFLVRDTRTLTEAKAERICTHSIMPALADRFFDSPGELESYSYAQVRTRATGDESIGPAAAGGYANPREQR